MQNKKIQKFEDLRKRISIKKNKIKICKVKFKFQIKVRLYVLYMGIGELRNTIASQGSFTVDTNCIEKIAIKQKYNKIRMKIVLVN